MNNETMKLYVQYGAGNEAVQVGLILMHRQHFAFKKYRSLVDYCAHN